MNNLSLAKSTRFPSLRYVDFRRKPTSEKSTHYVSFGDYAEPEDYALIELGSREKLILQQYGCIHLLDTCHCCRSYR